MSKPRRIKRLKRLRITEASLVDNGACPGAVICLWKRHDPDDHEEDEPMPEQHLTKSEVSDNMLAIAAAMHYGRRHRFPGAASMTAVPLATPSR